MATFMAHSRGHATGAPGMVWCVGGPDVSPGAACTVAVPFIVADRGVGIAEPTGTRCGVSGVDAIHFPPPGVEHVILAASCGAPVRGPGPDSDGGFIIYHNVPAVWSVDKAPYSGVHPPTSTYYQDVERD